MSFVVDRDAVERLRNEPLPQPIDMVSRTVLGRGLGGLYLELAKSGEVDMLGMHKVFREWNLRNLDDFTEDDDPYLALIEDFFLSCSFFESEKVGKKHNPEEKEKHMAKSIETQRELVRMVIADLYIEVGDTVNIRLEREDDFERLQDTMMFLDKFANELMQRDSARSSTSNVKPYLSGLRSMICAAILAKAGGFTVDFAEVKYDIKYDLDLLFRKGGKVFAVDVTTKQFVDPGRRPFDWFKDDRFARVPDGVKAAVGADHLSKLVLPSTFNNRSMYAGINGYISGIPSPEMIGGFRKATKP